MNINKRIPFLLVIQFLLFTSMHLNAQNFISNNSFEEVNFLNKGSKWRTYNGDEFTEMSIGWRCPTSSSPDYFVHGNNKTYKIKEYNAKFKDYKPKEGEKTVGISVFGCHEDSGPCREYVQTKLKEPLTIGEEYYVEFWVSRIRGGAVINNLGAYFSIECPMDNHIPEKEFLPQIFEDKLIGQKAFKWEKISGKFKADKSFEFITIGNMFKDDDTALLDNQKRSSARAYYFLDKIIVKPVINKIKENPKPWSNAEIGKTYILEKILFEFGKAIFLNESYKELNQLLGLLNEKQQIRIEITGHTDNIGSKESNLSLSVKRANSVRVFLVTKGIESERIKTKGVGSDQPISDNTTEEGRRLNRRVELKIH